MSADTLPFAPGEVLVFVGELGSFGRVGEGRMTVSGPERLRDESVLRLDFRFDARLMLMRVRDRTTSWLDPRRMASLRYRKDERHPLGTRREEADIFPDEARWENAAGASGRTSSEDPLDELSFLYLLRTIELGEGETRMLDRHFDPQRSPVRLVGRGEHRLTVPFGDVETRLVEMEVRDRERFGGAGRISVHVGQGSGHPLVRIASKLPAAGTLVLSLSEWARGEGHP